MIEEATLRPGWLMRQLDRIEKDIAQWPDSFKREAGFAIQAAAEQQQLAITRLEALESALEKWRLATVQLLKDNGAADWVAIDDSGQNLHWAALLFSRITILNNQLSSLRRPVCRCVGSAMPEGWWQVFSGSEKFDLGPKKPVAIVECKEHGQRLIDALWPGFGYMEEIETRKAA